MQIPEPLAADLPPSPPKPAAKDRATFTRRVKARIKELGLSGRKLEDRINMARGTLSKIYCGRIALSVETLREIARALQVGPETLVVKTTFAHLLLVAPSAPESEDLADARKVIDDLREDLVGSRAQADSLSAELKETRTELNAARREIDQLASQREQTEAKATAAAEELDKERAVRREGQAKLDQVQAQRDQLERDLEAQHQQLASAHAVRDQWRAYGQERAKRVEVLEAEVRRTVALARSENEFGWAKTILSGLTGLGLGIATASPSEEKLLAQYRPRR